MPAAPRKGELSMEIKEYQAAIEAVLFASGEPVAATRLAEVLELDLETAVRLADDWLQDVNTRGGGLLAVRLGDKYQLGQGVDKGAYRHAADSHQADGQRHVEAFAGKKPFKLGFFIKINLFSHGNAPFLRRSFVPLRWPMASGNPVRRR